MLVKQHPEKSLFVKHVAIQNNSKQFRFSMTLRYTLPPSPCTASFHTISVKAFRWRTTGERFHSRDQRLCKFLGTKESVYIRKEFNSHRIGLEHQYGGRDVMRKRSIWEKTRSDHVTRNALATWNNEDYGDANGRQSFCTVLRYH